MVGTGLETPNESPEETLNSQPRGTESGTVGRAGNLRRNHGAALRPAPSWHRIMAFDPPIGDEHLQILGPADIKAIRQHELNTGANATVGGYDMDKHCPLDECALHRVRLEAADRERVFLLPDFRKLTAGHSCRLRDVLKEAGSNPRVAAFSNPKVDLRTATNLELVVVSIATDGSPLIIIDGNHRAIAQYLEYGHLDDVPAYLCIHPHINRWGHVPIAARV
jgi:hypothetical protein